MDGGASVRTRAALCWMEPVHSNAFEMEAFGICFNKLQHQTGNHVFFLVELQLFTASLKCDAVPKPEVTERKLPADFICLSLCLFGLTLYLKVKQ